VLKVAVTGSIGSGKTEVCLFISGCGVPWVSSDDIARELREPGMPLWKLIRERWGEKYFQNEGRVDKDKLSADLLKDPFFRKELERMTHPLVFEKIKEKMDEWRNQGRDLGAAEVPLLYEAGWSRYFDRVISTCAARPVLLKRVAEKRGCSLEEAEKWVDMQFAQEEKVKRSDYCVETDIPREETERKVKKILSELRRKVNEDCRA